LKSQRAVLLLQDTQWEVAFACTHTLIVACTSPILCCIGWALVWISYRTVSGALLCSHQLFAPHFSAIDSLQECSSLFEELKGGAAFAGYVAGRPLHIFPTSFCDCFCFVYHIQQPCYY
jgi:hypothetical protein